MIAGLSLSELATNYKTCRQYGFLMAQLILISGWSLANLRVIPGLKAFDPFSLRLPSARRSSESVFLTILC